MNHVPEEKGRPRRSGEAAKEAESREGGGGEGGDSEDGGGGRRIEMVVHDGKY